MKIFTATENIALLGDLDPKWGQTYWGNVEEQEMPIKFNLMQQVDIMPGRKLVAQESEIKTSTKGNKYMQLKKVKLSESEKTPEKQSSIIEKYVGSIEEDDLVPKPTMIIETEEVPSYEAGTNARWALKLSTDTYKSVLGRVPEDETDWNTIEDFAKWLLGSFQRLKSYDPNGSVEQIKEADQPAVGYKKARATADNLKVDEEEGEEENMGDG